MRGWAREVKHTETIRREFSKQANRFGEQGLTLSSQEYLLWMVDVLPLSQAFWVLDVAAGTGHLSRAIAPHVRQVVAVDMTPAMLEKARAEARKAGLDNILFEECDAIALPYQDDSFDMVVSRLAIHHFEKPHVYLSEMARVCRPGHAVSVIDLLSPSDDSLFLTYNRLERLRDPSHVFALTQTQLIDAMKDAGLAIQRVDARDIPVDFDRWIEMTGAEEQAKVMVRNELEQELDGHGQTGMRPYMQDGRLKFMQTWCVVVGMVF